MTHGRRPAERKGDIRQREILDACQVLLAEKGYDAMTVGDIAAGAGLARGALYFYFGSKEQVVTALVARTVEQLWARSFDTAAAEDPRSAIADAIARTVQLWTSHGVVVRTAIDRSQTVPEIGALWGRTAELFIDAIDNVLQRAGVAQGTEFNQSAALAATLCWMIERNFYHASQSGPVQLQQASATCEYVWLTIAGLAPAV